MRMPTGVTVEILLHAVSSGETRSGVDYSYGEIYGVNLEAKKGSSSVAKYPTGMLFMDDSLSSMVVTDEGVYILGGDRHRDKTHDRVFQKLDTHFHARASFIDFINYGPGWEPLSDFKTLESEVTCVSLNGNIYVFGGNIKHPDGSFTKSPGEVLDPTHPTWLFLPTPPETALADEIYVSHVSTPALADTKQDRILVHFAHTSSLFAYYPHLRQWDFLLPFQYWHHLAALLDDMLLFHVPGKFSAFHLPTKKTYDPLFSTNFPTSLLWLHFDALFPLPAPATFCLAASVPDNDKTHLTFVKFRLDLTSSQQPQIIFISDHYLDLNCNTCVTDYVPAPTGNYDRVCYMSDEEKRRLAKEPYPGFVLRSSVLRSS